MGYSTPLNPNAVDTVFKSRRPTYDAVTIPANLPPLFYGAIEELPTR